MNKDIKISNDGTIFEIKDDGSISKIARISESGTVIPLNGSNPPVANNSRKETGWLWFFLAVFIIATFACAVSYYSMKEDNNKLAVQLQNTSSQHKSKISEYESKISNYKSQISDLENDVYNLNSRIKQIGNKVPFIVTDVKMGNMNNDGSMYSDYGNYIYSSSSMYLTPKIYYDGVKAGSYTIYWKIFYPDGTMSTGTSSPSGYSTSGTIYIAEGDNNTYSMSGWGGEKKGYWRSGTYRIEIWYNNSCLKSKNFTIH